MRVGRTLVLVVGTLLIAAVVIGMVGCRSQARAPVEPAPTSTATDTPTASPPAAIETPAAPVPEVGTRELPVRVYFVSGELITVAGRTSSSSAVAAEAMKALLRGPTAAEKSAGMSTQIPSGTRLLGVNIAKGTATVDLSGRFESGGGSLSMTLRISQVVSTLTQFPAVKRVTFRIDGKAVESIGGEGIIVAPSVHRADYESVMPPILAESPVPGQKVARPVLVAGTANVFEAQFRASVLDAAGKVIADVPITATSGSGTRGTFRERIAYPAGNAGKGTIRFYDPSEKDGSPESVVDVPVVLR